VLPSFLLAHKNQSTAFQHLIQCWFHFEGQVETIFVVSDASFNNPKHPFIRIKSSEIRVRHLKWKDIWQDSLGEQQPTHFLLVTL